MVGYTRILINSRLSGRIASLMLILSLLVVSQSILSQEIHTCGRANLTGAEVLQNAIPDPNTNGHVNNGTWTITSGLTITDPGGNNRATDDIISGFVAGNSYAVQWRHNSGAVYDVTIHVSGGPVVNTFTAVNPNPCGTTYIPQVLLDVSGGTGSYTIEIDDGIGAVDFSSSMPNPTINTTISLGTQTTDKTYTLITVEDANGCVATTLGTPQDFTFTPVVIPTVQNITGANTCTPNDITITLNGSEAGVNYYLTRNGVQVGGIFAGGGTLTWTESVVGLYEVYAVNPCGGVNVKMNGAFSLENLPTDKTFIVSGERCADTNPQVRFNNSELNVSYNLYREDRKTGVRIYSGISRTGDGGTVTFPIQLDDGIYTVEAESPSGNCSIFLSSTLTVINPMSYALTADDDRYCQGFASNIKVTLAGSEPGNSYQLRRDTGTGFADYSTAQGSGVGAALEWTNVPHGIYEVLVTTPEGCTETMGNVEITETLPPTATIAIGADNSKCAGTTKDFNPVITFTDGVAPFTFTVSDDKVPANTWTMVSPGYTYSGFKVDPNSTTTYTVTYVKGGGIDGCEGVGAGSATITVNESPTVTILGNSEVCSDQPLLLTSNPNITGAGLSITGVKWQNDLTTNSITVTPSTPPNTISTQVYNVTATASNGCTSTATHTVTVNPLPDITFSDLPDPYLNDNTFCENDAPIAMDATPTGGTYYVNGNPLGVGVTAFDPGNPAFLRDNNTIYYEVTNLNGCTNRASISPVNVKPLPTPQINNLPLTICSDAGAQIVYGIPAGGTFNVLGAGLNYTVTGNQLTINPGASAAGFPYTIEYEYSDGFGCTVTASQTTEIIDYSVGVLTLTSNPVMTLPLCPDDNTDYDLTGLVGGITVAASGGAATITGPGVTDNGDGTAVFNAVTAGPGQHDVTFTYTNNGCSSSTTMTIDVGINMTIDLVSSYCEGVPVQTITATPDGGTFRIKEPGGNITSPPNVVGAPAGTEQFLFDPSGLASVGKTGIYEISYIIDDGAGCITTQTWTTTIGGAVDASFSGLPLNVCENDGSYTLTPNYAGAATPTIMFSGPGIISNLGVFSPSAAGVGTHTITCSVDIAGNCQSIYTQDVTVVGTPNIDIINLDEAYCSDDAAVLISASNAGDAGTYSFSSTTSPSATNPNPLTYTGGDQDGTFNPAVDPSLLSWTYYVTYTFTPAGLGATCRSEVTKPVTIYRNEAIDYSGLTEAIYCQSDATFEIAGSEAGGEFYIDGVLWGAGLTDLGGGRAEVNPAVLAVGNHTITYSYERINPLKNCTNTRDRSFDIVDGPVGIYSVIGGGPYCLGDPAGVTVSLDGSTAGVVYELYLDGNPMVPARTITGPAGGGQIDFNTVTDLGTYTIVARQGTCERVMLGSAYVETYDLNLGINNITNVTCNGGNDGVVNLRGTGGSGAYEYYISDDAGATWTLNTNTVPNEFVNLSADTYHFRIIDMDVDASCVLDAARNVEVTILEPGNALTLGVAQIQKVGCNCATDPTQCDGIGSITINGGTKFTDLATYPSGYDIIWPATVTNLSADKLLASNLSVGTYSVVVTDALGCTETVTLTIENETPLSLVFVNQTNNKCYGTDEATATVDANGGSGNYEYSLNSDENWLTGADPYVTPILPTGAHTIWVRDAAHPNCKVSVNVNISGPATALDLNVVKTDQTCSGVNDGSIELQISGGVGPYRYSLDNGATINNVPTPSPLISGLATGAYTVIVYDVNDCQIVKSFGIDPATPITLSGVATAVSCNSGNDGRVVLTANPANVNYVYSIVAINGVVQAPVWQASNEFAGLNSEADLTKVYTFQVKDDVKGCTSTSIDIELKQPQSFSTTHTKTDVVCSGESNGSITLTTIYADASVGAFEYSIDGGATWKTSPLTGLSSGFYNIRVKDLSTNCEFDYATVVEITEPTNGVLSVTLDNKSNLDCVGDGDGEINVDVSGGWGNYSYQWRDKNTHENYGTAQDLSSLAASANKAVPGGTYILTVQDDHGCSTTFEESITEPLPWNITINTSPNTITNAATDAAIQGNGSANLAAVSGGSNSENFGYKWYYNFTGTVAAGAVTPGTEIAGTENATSINNLDPGNYYITITDLTDGCTETRNFTIGDTTIPLNVNVDFFQPECSGDNGRIEVSVLGGVPDYTIKYKRNADPQQIINTSSTNTVIAATPGSYTIIVEDSNGGVIEETLTINPQDGITITGTTSFVASCKSRISVTPVVPAGVGENYTASWTVPAGAPALLDVARTSADNGTAITHDVSIPGDYTITVKHDSKSCFETFTITVEDPTITVTEDLTRHKDVSCNGGNDAYLSVDVVGREPGHVFNYVWQNKTTGAAPISTGNRNTLGDAENVDAGLWEVTVETTPNTCSVTIPLSKVTEPTLPINITDITTQNVESCDTDNSGSVLIEVEGGTMPYTVTITDGTNAQSQTLSSSSFTFTNLLSGNYTVTLEDANNCGLDSDNFSITSPDPIIVTNFTGTIDCNPGTNDGQITFDITGGLQDLNNISSYAIIIEGDNGYSDSEVLNVDWDTEASPYHHVINGTTGLAAGTYTVKLWDANAAAGTNVTCPIPVFEQSVVLEQIYVSADIEHVSCSGGSDNGSITNFVVTGLSSNVIYEWNDLVAPVANLTDRTGLAPGTYQLTITDNDKGGCSVVTDFTINNGHTLVVSSFLKSDVSCYNGNDGRIEISASPVGGNYVYSIDGGTNWQSSNVFVGLQANTYQAKVRDLDYACESVNQAIIISQSPEISITAATKLLDISCQGESDASYRVAANDGVAGTLFEYAIELNGMGQPIYQDSPVFTNLGSGTYHLWVRRKGTDCTAYRADYFVVDEPTNGALSLSVDAASNLALDCYGDTDGSIIVNVSGGWAANDTEYSYEWRNKLTNAIVANTKDITLQAAGTYVLTVVDKNNICSITLEQTITAPNDWVASVSTTDNNIPNTDTGATGNGTATLSPVSGGSIPATYEFDWYKADGTLLSTDKTTTVLNGLNPGNYYVVITGDAATCTKRIDFTIGDTSKPLSIDVTHSDAACNGETGSIRVTMTSGTPPYAITIQQPGYAAVSVSTTNSTYLFENLDVATYNIEVVDALNGIVTDTEKINEPTAFTVAGSVSYDNCLAELTVDMVPVDDYLVTWTVPAGATTIPVTDFNGNQVVRPNISDKGEYIVTVQNKNTGCTQTTSIIVDEPSFTVIENVSQRRNVSCFGGSDGYISVSAVGKEPGHLYTYSWSNGTDTYSTNTVPSIGSAHPVVAGTWSVTVTSEDGKCSQILPDITISEPDELDISVITKTDITTCNGDNKGQIVVVVTGGSGTYHLDYTGDNITDLISNTGTFTVNDLNAGDYQIRVSDTNGCQTDPIEETVTIDQPDPLVITIDNANTSIDCETDGTGQIQFSVTGGNKVAGKPLYDIFVTGETARTDIDSEGTFTYNNLDADTYTITVVDKQASSPSTCTVAEQTIVLELLTITGDAIPNSCTSTSSNVGAIRNISITGASPTAVISWDEVNGDAVTDNAQLDQENLPAGSYILQVVDAERGCTVTKTFTIGTLTTLDILGTATPVTCHGADDGQISGVTVIGTANYDFLWSGPGTVDNSRVDAQTGLAPGIYSLTITDRDNACTFTKEWTITEPDAITYTLEYLVESCAPYRRGINIVNPQGGYGTVASDYTYTWVGPDASLVANSQNQTGLIVGGTYTVTVADSYCGVTKSIVVPEELVILADVSELNCNGSNNGAFDMTITGGSGDFTYTWEREYPTGTTNIVEGPDNDITNIDLSGQGPGIYTLTVIDNVEANGGTNCEYTWDYELIEPTPIVINGSVSNLICNGDKGGQIAINVSGGAGDYSYSWTTLDGFGLIASNQNQSGLTGGTYSVQVRDGNGCLSSIEDFTVVEPDAVDFTYVITPTSCDGTNGEIDITPTGGSGTYDYYWSASDGGVIDPANVNNQDQTGLPGGTYLLRVWDADPSENRSSCYIEKEIVLTKGITLNIDVTNQGCGGTENGQIDLNVSGGVGPYTFNWTTISGNNAKIIPNSQNQSGLSAGEYRVRVTDSRTPVACFVEQTVLLGLDVDLQINANISNASCYSGNDGAITLAQVLGGNGTYQYLWSGPVGSNIIQGQRNQTGLIAGEYRVTISDVASGCSVEQVYTVDQPDEIVITLDRLVDVLCKGEQTGEIEVSVTGGTGAYKYLWTGPDPDLVQDASTQSNLLAGDYTLIVSDANNCNSATFNVTIDEPAVELSASVVNVTNVSAQGGSDGSIEIAVAGGTGNKEITWTGVDHASAPIAGITQNTVNPSGLVAGIYTAVIEDDNNCIVTLDGIIVTEPDMALNMTVLKKDVQPCNGDDNGEISVTALGGLAPYDITISNAGGTVIGNTTADALRVTNLDEGVYNIVIEDDNGITINQSVTILEPVPLSITASVVNDVLCTGGNTGQIRYRVSGGKVTAPNNFYKVIVSGGSYYQEFTAVVADSDITVPGLESGTYKLQVIDDVDGTGTYHLGNNCDAETTVTISQPEAIVSIANDAEICDGESSSLLLTVSDYPVSAANPIEVTLSDGNTHILTTASTNITVNPSVGITVYQITSVTDGAGCTKGASDGSEAIVVVNELPSASITLVGGDEICNGEGAQFRISLLDGQRPWNVVYSDGSVNTSLNITAMDTVITVSPVVNQTYSLVSVNDGNCDGSVSGSVSITVNELPSATMSIDPANSTICYGASSELIFTFPTGSPDYKVSYSENGIAKTVNAIPLAGALGIEFRLPVSPLETTVYQLLSVQDSKGCDVPIADGTMITINVQQNPQDAGAITGDMIVCQGSTQTYSIETITGASSYEWTVPAAMGNILTGNGTTTITVAISESFTGNANIEVKGVNACNSGVASTLAITADPLPAKPITPVAIGSVNICEGEEGMRFRINAVANASSYTWTIPEGLEFVGDNDGTEIVLNVKSGYNNFTGEIRVTASNHCGAGEVSDALIVTVHPLPIANAGTDESGVCSTTHLLNAIDPGLGYTGTWTVISGTAQIAPGDQNNPNATITGISQGVSTFRWTVRNNATLCEDYDDVSIFNDQVSVSVYADKTQTCDGIVNVTGSAIPADAQSGTWAITAGSGNISTPTDAHKAIISNLAPGLNTVEWTVVKNGCESKASVNVMNNVPTEPEIFNNTGTAVTLIDLPCQDDFTTISGTVPAIAGETGTWKVIAGSATIAPNVNASTINLTNMAKGETVLTWTIQNGSCTRVASVTIRNNALNVDAGDDAILCGDEYTLDGTIPGPGVTGEWSIPSGMGVGVVTNGTSPNATITGLGRGANTLRWTLTKNGCQSYDEVVITNNAATQATVGAEQVICAYETDLTGNAPSTVFSERGYWTVIKGSAQFDDFEQPDTHVTGLAHGENILRWNIVHNESCTSYADLKIVNLHVDVYAGKDTIICGKTITLNANSPEPGDIAEWTLTGVGGGTIKPGEHGIPNALVGALDYGRNGFVWSITHEMNDKTCVSSDTVYVSNDNPYYTDSEGDRREVSAGDPISVTVSSTVLAAIDPEVGSGFWSLISGGGVIDDPTKAGTVVTDLRRGENVFRWTVTNGVCSYFSDVTVTNGSVEEANAGRNDTTCVGAIHLSANEPINALGEWSVVEGSGVFDDKTKFNTWVRGLDEGENRFVWTLYNGSTTSSDEVIIVNNIVAQANAGDDDEICAIDEYELSAVEPMPGRGVVQWSVVSGSGTFDDETSPATFVRGLSQGVNTLKYRISLDKCYSEAYVTITNNTPTTPDAGEDKVICTDSLKLKPNTPTYGIGEWTVENGYADPDALDENWAKRLSPGENKLIWTINNNNCKLSDEIIIINNEPDEANAGQDVVEGLCVDHTFLDAGPVLSGRGVGHWELVAGSGAITDAANPKSEVTGLGTGVNRFRWVVDNNGCISTDEVNISNNFIESIAGNDQVICADTAVLKANSAHPGSGTWGVLAGSGSANFDDPTSPFTKVRGLQQGDNTLLWTINYGGCSHTSSLVITNDSPSPAFAGDNQSLCVTNNTVLNANIPAKGTGEWSIRNGSANFSSMTDANPNITDLAFGDNLFRWTVTHNACVSVSDVQVSYNRVEAIAGEAQELCSDETQLEGNTANPGVGTWTVVGGTSQAIFEDVNNPNSKVSNLAKGSNLIRWTINYRGCETFSEVNLTNNSPSTAYAGNLQELCEDNTVLDATAPVIGVGTWEVLMGSAAIANANDPKSAVTGLSKGDNVFRWTVTNGICSSVDEIRVINNEPSIPYAGADEEICYNTLKLKAEAPEFGTGLWTIDDGAGNFDDPTNPTATISNLKPGENTLRWTITQGQCDLYKLIKVTNNAADLAHAGPDIEDCNDWSQLDANIPETGLGTGAWTLVSGKGDFDNTTDAKTTIRNLGFGENILMWTITNGSCFTSDQVTIFNKIPDQSAAGDDRTTCEDYIVLNANDPVDGTGTWSVVSGSGTFEDASQHNTMVTDIGYGENIYMWTIAYGDCTTDDKVTVVSNKANPYAGEDDVTYEPDYAMQAQNPGQLQGQWTIVAGGGTFDDAGFFNTTVRNLPVGKSTFRWTITTDGCEAYDEVTIEYKEVPEAGFKVDVEQGCYPLEVKFTNYSVGGNNYTWDFGDGDSFTTNNVAGPEHTYEDAGVYTAVLTIAGPDGNDAVYTHKIVVHDHPVADFNVGPEVVYLPQDEIKCYDLSIDAISWLWEFGDGQTSDLQNPAYTYSREGIYDITLTVRNLFGCENSFTKSDAVDARMSGFVEFPNAFRPRPGGAGNSGTIGERNDAIFKPKHDDVEQYHIQIFNRWGQLIYESKEIDEGWDGNFKGQLAPQAVYVYKVAGKFTNGREFNKAGSVLLVR
ncbi:MAG: PKD domain-containing protein [Carboxylicivirga sp.]|nr:PKD domain-containing protein [Carboxylicivirga sp.]